jgi:hypothetical protein
VPALEPRALVVDVVSTRVDWRGRIIAEGPSVRTSRSSSASS